MLETTTLVVVAGPKCAVFGSAARVGRAPLPRVPMMKPAASGAWTFAATSLPGVQRFLSVIPTPAPSISKNDVSRSGLVVIAST
jgi:hypothetical protein